MSTNFPTSVDSFTNPVSTNPLSSPDHAAQHANINDSVLALETKVGIDSSAVATTLDYKLKSTSSIDPGHKHTASSVSGFAVDPGGNGLVARTASGSAAARTITGTANQVTVTNGDGVSGNPTLATPQNIDTGATPQFSRLGLGGAADANAKMKAVGQYLSARFDNGNSSTAKTIDFNNGNSQIVTLTGNCTFTFSNPVAGAKYLLELKQDGTGSRTATWPATVKWSGASAPVLTTTAGQTDVIMFYYNGTNYAGSSILNFAL